MAKYITQIQTDTGLKRIDFNALANRPSIPSLKGKEERRNRVRKVDEHSTHNQYPTAKAVFDALSGGVSPKVEVTDIDGGRRIIITDVTGVNTFDLMDGEAGDSGVYCGDEAPPNSASVWIDESETASGMGSGIDILWANSDPTVEFAAQTVSPDGLGSYDVFYAGFRKSTTDTQQAYAVAYVSSDTEEMSFHITDPFIDESYQLTTIQRDFYIHLGDGTLRFSDGRIAGGTAASNDILIPTFVLGACIGVNYPDVITTALNTEV